MKTETISESVIADNPPNDGRSWRGQCARCGSSVEHEPCDRCGGEGVTDYGELHEQDPLWYDEDDVEPCPNCGGDGGWVFCMSSETWCKEHPINGRESVGRGAIEWFTFDETTQKTGTP